MACATACREAVTVVKAFNGPTPESEWKDRGIHVPEAGAVYVFTH